MSKAGFRDVRPIEERPKGVVKHRGGSPFFRRTAIRAGLPEDESTDEEKAREIAIGICGEFEELLDEKNIMVPSADRRGWPEEACLYGEEDWRLEDAITDLLLEQPDMKVPTDGVENASHSVRELAIRICDEFEELLGEKDITIPSRDRKGDPEEACLFGSEYYALEDAVVRILVEELGVATTSGQIAAISEDTRAVVERMQKATAAASEGGATIRSAKVCARTASARPKPRCGTSVPSR